MPFRKRLFRYCLLPIALLTLSVAAFFTLTTLFPSDRENSDDEQHTSHDKSAAKLYPSEWAMLQRTFPYGTADKTAHLDAMRQAQAMRTLQKSAGSSSLWEFAGPTNIGGRITDIEFNPQDNAIVYAGAATGGVFKSTDSGLTWFPIFDEQAVLPIGDLAIDPNNPNVVYAGTGEANGGHNNFFGGGLFKSTDAGASWQIIGLEKTFAIGRIVIDPSNSERVYVAAIGSYFGKDRDRGVYRSTNAGVTWEQVLFVNDSTGAIDLVINPQQPEILYTATWQRLRPPTVPAELYGDGSGVYRTTDSGDTWSLLGEDHGLPGPGNRIGRIGLAICTSQPQHLYALYTDFSQGYTYHGLFRTRDGGDSWERTDSSDRLADGFATFSWYFGNIRVSPDNPEIVYVLDVALNGSFDGGQSWFFQYGYGGPSDLHVDHHALAFDPIDSQRLLSGNDGGLNISTDAGLSWNKVANLPVTQFYQITIDVTNPERLYGGTQDNGTLCTQTGMLDDWRDIFGGDGFYVIVHPTNPNIIYAESQFGNLGKSTNGGSRFFGALSGINGSEPTNWSTPVVMDPNDPEVLYYGTNRVYRTSNGATRWGAVSPDLTEVPPGSRLGTVTTIAVAPSNSAVVYAGTDNSNVWVTADTGTTWTKISEALPFRWVTRVAVDPFDERIAYVTFSGLKWNSPQPHVFRTTDMGVNWTDISNNLPDSPVNTLMVDPAFPDFLYVGSDVGAFYSENAGQYWEALGQGLPMISVYDLAIHPAQRILVAGTHGRSMYKLALGTVTGIKTPDGTPTPSTPHLAQNYPNPFNPSTTITFALSQPEHASVSIYDLSGRRVRNLIDRELTAGEHRILWDGRDDLGMPVATGLYIYRLTAGADQVEKKMALVH